MAKIKQDTRPLGDPQSWARFPGTYLAGQAAIDGVDKLAIEMEQRWGAGRLRLLVPLELRERFDRQRFKFNAAVWHGDLETLRTESARMAVAWKALDGAAEAAGAAKLDPVVWEVGLEDGTVAAIVRSPEMVNAVQAQGRRVAVYTLDEISRILSTWRVVRDAKLTFPGSVVTAVRQTIEDPLDRLRDQKLLDDTLDDMLLGQEYEH